MKSTTPTQDGTFSTDNRIVRRGGEAPSMGRGGFKRSNTENPL